MGNIKYFILFVLACLSFSYNNKYKAGNIIIIPIMRCTNTESPSNKNPTIIGINIDILPLSAVILIPKYLIDSA